MNEKVCILTSVHIVWDTRIYHREAVSLAQAGYRVTLVATGVASQTTPEQVEIIGLERPRPRAGRLLNWLPFLRAALRTQADIFHFHDPDLLFVGVLLRLLSGRPVIYDCHEPYREAMLEKEWLPRPAQSLVGLIYDSVEAICCRFLSAVIVANPLQQSHFPHATLVANFPNLEVFDLHRQPDGSATQVVHLGSLSQARGIPDLVEACQWLTGKETSVTLIGPFADEDTRSAVSRLINEHNLGDRVKCTGAMPYQHSIEFLTHSSIGVVPWRKMPAFTICVPTKLFEYMASGLAVVASDLPPITPFIQEADCGIVVPPEDPRALAQAIQYLLDHPQEAQRMGQNGRRFVMEKYNWVGEAQKLLGLYQSLLKAKT